jgi:hypothetical protein
MTSSGIEPVTFRLVAEIRILKMISCIYYIMYRIVCCMPMMASGLRCRNYVSDSKYGFLCVEISDENFCLTGELSQHLLTSAHITKLTHNME